MHLYSPTWSHATQCMCLLSSSTSASEPSLRCQRFERCEWTGIRPGSHLAALSSSTRSKQYGTLRRWDSSGIPRFLDGVGRGSCVLAVILWDCGRFHWGLDSCVSSCREGRIWRRIGPENGVYGCLMLCGGVPASLWAGWCPARDGEGHEEVTRTSMFTITIITTTTTTTTTTKIIIIIIVVQNLTIYIIRTLSMRILVLCSAFLAYSLEGHCTYCVQWVQFE